MSSVVAGTKPAATDAKGPLPGHDAPSEESTGTGAPASPQQLSTEQQLLQAILPERDQRLLAIRLKNNGQEIPLTISNNGAGYQLGDVDTFWVTNNEEGSPQQFQGTATLAFTTDQRSP